MESKSRKSKNDVVREGLAPLREGERPHALTVAAIISLAIGVGNTAIYFAGVHSINGAHTTLAGVVPPALLLVVTAIGMWRTKYWAVLSFEAFLALSIVALSLALLSRTDLLAVLLICFVIASFGTLFWLLVRVMARIQSRSFASALDDIT